MNLTTHKHRFPSQSLKISKCLSIQGNALFIFITDPSILSHLSSRQDPKSTLFTQTLFLKDHYLMKMRKFIDEITLRKKNNSEESTTKILKTIFVMNHKRIFILYIM